MTSWEPAAAAVQMSELRDCKRETAQCSDIKTHLEQPSLPLTLGGKKAVDERLH